MRRTALFSLASLLLVLAAPAFACHFDTFTPMADCDGWSVEGLIVFSGGDTVADVSWTIALHDGDGLVAEYSGMETFYDSDPHFSFSGTWDMELCGEYTVSGTLHLESAQSIDDESFELPPFLCECDEPEPELCTWTPGYWKNHEEMWPVMELTVGCMDYSQMELLDIFDWPTRGDATVKLFHHLVAAKLNILVNGDDSMDDVIAMPDDFLCDHPLGSKPDGDLKDMANDLKDQLNGYNEEWPCDDEMDDGDDDYTNFTTTPARDATWGAVKAGYR